MPGGDIEILEKAPAGTYFVDLPSGVCVADIFASDRELEKV